MSDMNVYFVRTRWNYYSVATLFAIVEELDFVKPHFIAFEELDHVNIPDGSVICFSLNTIFYKQNKEEIIRIIKRLKSYKNYHFIAGGPHCLINSSELLQDGFDVLSVGSGEKNLITILFHIKNNIPLASIFKEHITSLDDYKPFPTKHFYYKPIEITRGCPHCCKFCQTSFLFGTRLYHRSPENIFKYVKFAFEKNIKDFRFISPNALSYGSDGLKINLPAIEELLSGLKKILGQSGRIFFGSFPSEVRPEFITPEVLAILKKYVDNKRLTIGAQTGSERLLKLSHRGHSKDQIINAIDLTIESGFTADVDIIFGMPDETEEDIYETLDLINKYRNKNVKFHLHYFLPLPGTPWHTKKPAELPQKIIKKLEYLTGIGLIWGLWKYQKQFSTSS